MNGFVSTIDIRPQAPELERSRSELLTDAKNALLDNELHRRVIGEETENFWQTANVHVHATLPGLAQQFGISIEDLVPDDFEEAFLKANEHLEKALDSYVLLKCGPGHEKRRRFVRRTPTEMNHVYLTTRYDETVLQDLALFAFYIAHRLLDFTRDIFTIRDREFLNAYRAWHREMRRRDSGCQRPTNATI